ncbi:MAG TPA: carbohydrate ABC transporter permease [Symbiobacteriaceae bacterium]|nr:carbohydrate ABC transporter permease [Symbiobacteriaceae bacterium]
MTRVKIQKQLPYVLLFLVIGALAVVWLAPLLYIISTSLKPESETITWPLRWIPLHFTLDNYREILFSNAKAPLLRWMWNSLFTATAHTSLVLLVSSLAAYGYAKVEFKGRDTIFAILMATMMVPGVINFVPAFLIVDKLQWVDTYLALIMPGLGGVFGVFLLRQFFKGIPKDLEDAARIDGAGPLRIWAQIIMPLAVPALVTLAVFTFMGHWNDFLWPLIVTNTVTMRTLPPGLTMFQSQYISFYGRLTAGAVVSALPVLLVFLFAQRYFIKGITLSGLKG